MRIDRIKFAAELMRQDMTQKALAEKSGVSRVTITGIKSGRRAGRHFRRHQKHFPVWMIPWMRPQTVSEQH